LFPQHGRAREPVDGKGTAEFGGGDWVTLGVKTELDRRLVHGIMAPLDVGQQVFLSAGLSAFAAMRSNPPAEAKKT